MVPVADIVAVPIESFRDMTRDINFDVFLKLAEDNIAHVFSRTTGLDYKRLASYIEKGVTHLYVRAEDLENYKAFVARPANDIFKDDKASAEKKIAALLNMTEQNMSEIFSQLNVRKETANDTQRLIKNYVELMTKSPQTLAVILKLVSHGEYLYYHSIAVSVFSLFISKATGQFNKRMLELVGLGGFLHDIGCTQLPKELLEYPSEYNDEQWMEMKEHSKLGLNMLENTKNIADEVRYIVYQHHEEPGGKGYPNRLYGPTIFYPAKIVSLADSFTALISKRPYRPAFSAEQAVHILQEQHGKHDRELVDVLASIILRDPVKKSA